MRRIVSSISIITCFMMSILCLSAPVSAQEIATVQWLSFEELEDSLAVKPKKVFIDFYTDWCTYCRKMDKVVFTKPEVIRLLNEKYYAVRFNAESGASIMFGGRILVNDQMGRSRNPIHQIAQLLALREGRFVAPTMVVLDENFSVTSRYFRYLDSRHLLEALK